MYTHIYPILYYVISYIYVYIYIHIYTYSLKPRLHAIDPMLLRHRDLPVVCDKIARFD